MSKPRSGEATPRRDFLRTLALAPAAAAVAAGCATPRAAGGGPEGAPPTDGEAATAAPAAEDAGLRAVRAVPLAMEAEPAFVFRAAPARPGE